MNETSKKTIQATVEWLTIDEHSDGQRLDNFLVKTYKGVPKSHFYKMIRKGEIRINSKRAEVSTRLVLGDSVRIPPIRISQRDQSALSPTVVKAHQHPLPIVFEDDTLIAVNKPAGMAVHGGSGISLGVIEILRLQRPEARFLELVHRLDRDTSGLLLVAKKRRVLLALHEALRIGTVDKRYWALVDGRVTKQQQTIRFPLYTHRLSNGERRVKIDKIQGKDASTKVSVLKTIEADPGMVTLVEASPLTGRTHQIRVHLAGIGHPIIGDDKYGIFEKNRLWAKLGHKRMFLHAIRLTFDHPETEEKMQLVAPLPEALEAYLSLAESSLISNE